jgi:uncharacterized protein YraI
MSITQAKCITAITMNVDLGNGDKPMIMAEAGERITVHGCSNGVYTVSSTTSGGELFYVTAEQITDLLDS